MNFSASRSRDQELANIERMQAEQQTAQVGRLADQLAPNQSPEARSAMTYRLRDILDNPFDRYARYH